MSDVLPPGADSIRIPYPRSIPFILVSKLFERLATESVRVVMLLYLIDQLAFSAANALVLFHSYNTISYLMAIVGALLADVWVGRYWATLYTHLVFMLGTILLALCAVRELQLVWPLALTSAAIIGIGNGCMKPCLVALSGDQFQLPEQQPEMSRFFSAFYFSLKCSSVLMSAVAPALRSDFPGLSPDRGYLIVFGAAAGEAIVSILVFLAASKLYVRRPASGNQLAQLWQCIWYGTRKRWSGSCRSADGATVRDRSVKDSADDRHWLNVAEPRYGAHMVQDGKILLRILLMLAPLPMYWALNEQISSTWTLQASRLNGDLWGMYTIKPDQMQVVMQVFVLVFIPVCEAGVYPLLSCIGVNSALRRIVVAGALSAAAFAMAGTLELWMRSRSDGVIVHMLCILPQYVLLALAEAIVGVCGYVFVSAESPGNLKAILQAALLMTHSFGNIIDAAVLGIVPIDNQVKL